MRFGFRLALLVGRRVGRVLLLPISLYFFMARPRERAASRKYLGRALGRQAGTWDVLLHIHCFASTLLDRVYLLAGRHDDFEVRVHGEEAVAAAAGEGAGCLLLGAHLGSFEVLSYLGRQRLRVHLAMYEENARNISAVLGDFAVEGAPSVIALGRMDSMLRIEEALAGGGAVGLLADRTFEAKGTLSLPFFGEEAHFPTGPMRLAATLGRPVFFMVGLYRGGRRYDVHFERLTEAQPPGMPRGRFVEGAMRRYAARLEHHCRSAPYNWFNFYDYWK